MMRKSIFYLLLILTTAAVMIYGCKKLDFTKIPFVSSDQVNNVKSSTADAYGIVSDMGEDGITDHGFCWAAGNSKPTIANNVLSRGVPNSTGTYNATITNLSNNTQYYLRAYIRTTDVEVLYGDVITFTTLAVGPPNAWLFYDNGTNFEGIGLSNGGNLDVAIRFPANEVSIYDGYKIDKVRFFPKESNQDYYITVWEGSAPPFLLTYEEVLSPVIGDWNEVSVQADLYVDGSKELWIGCWMPDQPAGTHPAGCDAGPTEATYSDLYSSDDGVTWFSLYEQNNDLNYNWNIRVYLTSLKGDVVVLEPGKAAQITRPASENNSPSGYPEEMSVSNNY